MKYILALFIGFLVLIIYSSCFVSAKVSSLEETEELDMLFRK